VADFPAGRFRSAGTVRAGSGHDRWARDAGHGCGGTKERLGGGEVAVLVERLTGSDLAKAAGRLMAIKSVINLIEQALFVAKF
jgi:hypothetical protein